LKNHVMVLASGGIDSTAVMNFYLEQKFFVLALFVDFGQHAIKEEEKAVSKVCEHYDVPSKKVSFSGFNITSDGFIVGRNALLLHTALMEFQERKGIISIGVHLGTRYADCSEEFIRIMQASFDLYTNGRISIGVPFLNWNKKEIWDYCISHQVPLNLTYSCELGLIQPCGRCKSCKDLEVLYAGSS